MTPQWITAACALVAVGITLIGILVNPFKKINNKLDELDKHAKGLENNQNAILGAVRSIAPDSAVTVLDSVVSPRRTE
jgi:uncharacterized protein YoxC